MRFNFIPIDFDYFDFEGENYVQLVGRNEEGEKICVIDSYESNFWVILKENADAEGIAAKIVKAKIIKPSRTTVVLKTEIYDKKFLGKDVKAIKIFITNHKDAHDIASEIGDIDEIWKRREYDIPIITKYIKEKKVQPLMWHDVEARELTDEDFNGINKKINLDKCYIAESIFLTEKELEFTPKILAYDIETSEREIGKGEISMVSLFGDNIRKVLTWKECESAGNYVEFFEDEKTMLKEFSKQVREANADILTGYFSDGFDLPYIKSRCDKYKMKLDLGTNGKNPSFNKGRIPSGKISGTVHVDLYRFINSVFSQYLQSETLSLDEVAKELIGETKEEFDFSKLSNMSDSDWGKFMSYNLQDSKVTHKLALKIWTDIFEFCKIIKEPLFDITRDSMATHVENHILHNLDRFNEVAEKRPGYSELQERKMKGKFGGALVREPKPGFYENIVMFDFTSMHASIIVSFNISRATLHEEESEDVYESPEFDLDNIPTKVYFDKKQGFFATLLSEVVDKRKKFKKEYAANKNAMTKARSNAYKLLANATFGYQGFFGARYYSREAAAATLAFVRKFTTDTIATIEDAGFEIVYSDTDSIAFLQNEKSVDDIMKFLKELNDKLPGIMELDLEDFYKRGLFVAKRSATKGGAREGAKKKYALMDSKDKIKIRGFETVRRDWCKLTRRLQSEMLEKILREGNEKAALILAKDVISKLKKREIDKNDLLIKTQLRRPLNEYTSQGPHVIAAKKIGETGIPIQVGMVIEYYIGEAKGKLVRDKVMLPNENVKYDINYYLNSQILPAIENIFDVFGVDIQGIVDGETQKTLF
ncbi:ribonuclease H-like domain-containing protein [Candidatus Pacearchaeota archaeon]|nr:ribonuclease H-like domain-containing protein [Candidatus Pacearchaeota archaeon]